MSELLAAVCARILPSEDGLGASEAGVATYVEKALLEPRHRDLAELIEQGLSVLDALAEELFGCELAACDAAQQDEAIRRLQAFPGALVAKFMRGLVALCLEGFLCDPRHGGNRGEAGWRAIGYSGAMAASHRCGEDAP